MFDVVLQNALTVLPNAMQPLTVAIKNGRIAAFAEPGAPVEAAAAYDLSGMYLFPGAIDSHAHVTYCGSFEDGSRTAAAGGVTTLIEMPTSGHLPNVMNEPVFTERVYEIGAHSIVDVALWGGASARDPEPLKALSELGAAAFKAFTCQAGEYGWFNTFELMELMKRAESLNLVVGVHAETESICAETTRRVRAAGHGAEANNASRPLISEVLAASKAAMLALETGARLHICHVSSHRVAQAVRPFREAGARITLETCPHYLLLTEADVVRCGTYAKCSPPIRDEEAREGLWNAIIRAEIDIVGSDHAAYSESQKETENFWLAPGGFPGLDLLLAGLFSEGVVKRGMSPVQLAHVTSTNCAQAFGLAHRKGAIALGLDADFAVIDPAAQWTFHAADAQYINKSDRYPYEGRQFTGKVVQTFVRGKEIYRDGRVLCERGGAFIPAQS